MNIDVENLEKIVRKVLAEELGKRDEFSGKMTRDKLPEGIISIKGSSVKCEKFDTGNSQDEVYLKDVVSLSESARLGAGYMEILKDKPFEWTLNYDEVDVVLEGVLEIVTKSGKVRAYAGDSIFIPKGSSIHFTCPEGEKTRFVYVTYPADWQ